MSRRNVYRAQAGKEAGISSAVIALAILTEKELIPGIFVSLQYRGVWQKAAMTQRSHAGLAVQISP